MAYCTYIINTICVNVNPIRSQLEHNAIIDRFHFNVLFYFLDKTVDTKAHANVTYNTMYISYL